jgi:hypothetical protein
LLEFIYGFHVYRCFPLKEKETSCLSIPLPLHAKKTSLHPGISS